jgi:alpha-N-arabinofuranosidase
MAADFPIDPPKMPGIIEVHHGATWRKVSRGKGGSMGARSHARNIVAFGTHIACVFASAALLAAEVTLNIDAANPSHAVSPQLIGIFLEDINFGVDGGLNAELVKNGSFEFPAGMMGWSSSVRNQALEEVAQLRDEDPAFPNNPHYLRLNATNAKGASVIANEGFRGIGVQAGEKYQFSVTARSTGNAAAQLRVSLVDSDGKVLAQAEIASIGDTWSEHGNTLLPTATVADARLKLAVVSRGVVDVDMVSLCPEKTWQGRPHGQRADIVQALTDLKPAFFRFPGGCIVEGSQIGDRFQWKQTIGPRPDRKLNFNRWNTVFRHRPAPDYYQSYGLGFFEYFQIAEDIGAEPLPILNCGMACQFQSAELVPLEELQPYLDDVFDLIEFAKGPVTSEWGAKRAAMGHPEPFHLKMIGIGNEQWGPEYFERYEVFAKALKEKHPEIKLVSSTGPFPNDPKFHDAWPRLRALDADIVDEHCYAMPDWFLRSATRFDDYDRNGPKVFMGEYAVQTVDICSPDNRNTLRGALAEAAFLTGIERNSDVVTMSAYAPLLGHVDAWQWRPNLIWFDNLSVFVTPNYYVQLLFGRHRGDRVLPLELNDSRPPQSAHGRIGLATENAAAEFRDLRVERDGETLFTGNQLAEPQNTTTIRGSWELDGGVLRQDSLGEAARAQFGDPKWEDCTISLKARKLDGPGGIGIAFRNGEGGSFLEWTLGSQDKQHQIMAHQATHSEDRNVVAQSPGEIEAGRWYDVKIELEGDDVRCYLDGALVHDVTIAPPNLSRVFAVASTDEDANELILKIVNPTEDATPVAMSLGGANVPAQRAKLVVLSGGPEDENSLAEPQRVTPKSSMVAVDGARFEHTFPPHSLSVLRIKSTGETAGRGD